MIRSGLILFIAFLSFNSFGQRTGIIGSIKEANTGEGIPFASVVLTQNNLPTNNGAVSKEDGSFKLINIRPGSYDLVVSFIGFKNDTLKNLEVGSGADILEIGAIEMEASEYALEEVEVTGTRDAAVKKIDRQRYMASEFETSRGGNAVDILNRLPAVSVSPDGGVSVRGTSDFLVYLNGKPTKMEPSMLLAQISADQVQSIELITVPSAKYEAQGKGGIINIQTRTGGLAGLTVLANAFGGGAPWGHKQDVYSGYNMNDNRYTGNLSILYNKEGLNLYANAAYSMKNVNGLRVGDARIFDPSIGAFKHMIADGERPEWYENISASAGADYKINDESRIAGSYYYGQRTEGRSAFYVYEVFYGAEDKSEISGIPVNRQWIYNPNTDNRYGKFHTADLEYELSIGSRSGIKMSALMERSGLNRVLDNYNYNYNEVTDAVGLVTDHYQQSDDTPLSAYRLSFDYHIDISPYHRFEAGIQPQFLGIGGGFSYDTLNPANEGLLDYTDLENSIELQRNIYAGYFNYTGVSWGVDYMLGLRMEYTDQLMQIENPNYFSIFDRPTQSDYSLQKLNWFPSLHMSYDIGEDQLVFAASRRISRPPVKNMAPFLYRRHYEVYVVGDPSLQPEFSNTAELSFNKEVGKSDVTATAFYRGVENAIFRVNTIYYDETVLIRSYTNSGQTAATGGEVNSNLVLGSKAKLFLGGSLYRFHVEGDVFGYQENNTSMNWSLKSALNLQLTRNFKWTTDFDMQSATVTAQGSNEMFYFLNTALSYSPKSMSNWEFNLKGLDLLSSNVKGLDTRAYNELGEQIFYQETTYFRFGPILELGISYSFNSGQRKARISGSEFGNKEF